MEENFEKPDLFDDEERVEFIEDEGDEDDLGVPIKDDKQDIDDISSVNDDVVDLNNEVLDDSEYDDSSFDCD